MSATDTHVCPRCGRGRNPLDPKEAARCWYCQSEEAPMEKDNRGTGSTCPCENPYCTSHPERSPLAPAATHEEAVAQEVHYAAALPPLPSVADLTRQKITWTNLPVPPPDSVLHINGVPVLSRPDHSGPVLTEEMILDAAWEHLERARQREEIAAAEKNEIRNLTHYPGVPSVPRTFWGLPDDRAQEARDALRVKGEAHAQVTLYAVYSDGPIESSHPRVIAEMSYKDWIAGKDIPRPRVLSWGAAWECPIEDEFYRGLSDYVKAAREKQRAATPPNLDDRVAPEATKAFRALLALEDHQRAMILCWFCDCGRHVRPGESFCCN